MMPEVTDHPDVFMLTEQIIHEMNGEHEIVDARIHRALMTIRLAERFVSDEERMSLEGDFYERFARLVLSGETFDSVEQSAAALIYLFHDVRDGMLIEDCAALVHVSFDDSRQRRSVPINAF